MASLKKKAIRSARWLAAIIVAAFGSMRRFTRSEIWIAICGLFRALTARKGDSVSRSLYIQRMRRCHRCPLFFKKLATCGSPFSRRPELGCFCYCPGAARLPDHHCWLDENTDGNTGHGWQEL